MVFASSKPAVPASISTLFLAMWTVNEIDLISHNVLAAIDQVVDSDVLLDVITLAIDAGDAPGRSDG